MKPKRVKLQASLNLDDPFEMELYDFAMQQGKTSSYIKRLILLDKLGKTNAPQPYVPVAPKPVAPVDNNRKKAALNQLEI